VPAYAGQVAQGMSFTHGTQVLRGPGTVSLEGVGFVSDRGMCVRLASLSKPETRCLTLLHASAPWSIVAPTFG